MKKIILFVTILCLTSCVFNKKRNEELQFYNFNNTHKPVVRKLDVYLTKVTRFDTFSKAVASVSREYDNKVDLAGSWDFSQKPSKKLESEIFDQAVRLGANYIIMFEKANCDTLDVERARYGALEKSNCYRINYYNLPDVSVDTRNKERELRSVVLPAKTSKVIPTETIIEQKEVGSL